MFDQLNLTLSLMEIGYNGYMTLSLILLPVCNKELISAF